MTHSASHFADRLRAAVARRGTPACVGIDPVFAGLPACLREGVDAVSSGAVEAIATYGRGIVEAVADMVGVVKINVAFFEPYRGAGLDAYFDLVAFARSAGLVVIGDIKRGDIGHTSAAYAAAHLGDRDSGPDAVTINGYFGTDGVAPFLDVCRREGKGVFVLVHTSNASAGEVQHIATADGSNVAQRMASLVAGWSRQDGMIGTCGESCVGAVVAPDDVDRARSLREAMPDSVFLVPGFGAQGRSVEQVAACFRSGGTGAIVNSSRGVIRAYEKEEYAPKREEDWADSVRQACRDFVEALSGIRATV